MDGETSQNFDSFQPQPKVQPQAQPQAQPQSQESGLASIGDLFSKTWHVHTSHLRILLNIMAIWVGFSILFGVINKIYGNGMGPMSIMTIEGAVYSFQRLINHLQLPTFSHLLIFSAILISSAIINSWVMISLLYAIKNREQKIGIKKL